MLYLSIYSWKPENRRAIVARFMETGGKPPSGIKLVGRWTAVGGGRGFSLMESDDPVAVSKFAYDWNDLMEFTTIPVINDEHLAKVLAG